MGSNYRNIPFQNRAWGCSTTDLGWNFELICFLSNSFIKIRKWGASRINIFPCALSTQMSCMLIDCTYLNQCTGVIWRTHQLSSCLDSGGYEILFCLGRLSWCLESWNYISSECLLSFFCIKQQKKKYVRNVPWKVCKYNVLKSMLAWDFL